MNPSDVTIVTPWVDHPELAKDYWKAVAHTGAQVLVMEKASPEERGGNSRFTGGIVRFVYDGDGKRVKSVFNGTTTIQTSTSTPTQTSTPTPPIFRFNTPATAKIESRSASASNRLRFIRPRR